MKHSIVRQFALIFIGLMAGTILLCWFINDTFLEKYYKIQKAMDVQEAYLQINQSAMSGDLLAEDFRIELEKVRDQFNISVIIIDYNSKIVYSSAHEVDILKNRLLRYIFQSLGETGLEDGSLIPRSSFLIQTFDERTNTEYLEMWGVLDNGQFFLIRTAVEGIRDSVNIANRFFAYAGFAVTLLSSLLFLLVSRKLTVPIQRLATISERMMNLDFTAKYEGRKKRQNEIDLLGANMNQLSETLEKTISELKVANIELQRDIDQKNKIDEMRKEFLSNVSHELKTPIALIQGYAEGLHDGISDEESSREFYCEVIMDEANKMNTMVKKLLDLNQLEFGNDNLTMERFDIVELIRNTLMSMDILLKDKEVEVSFADYEKSYVWADEFKTEEVFRNYLSNAMNHVNEKKRIDVRLTTGMNKIRISVFNTGNPIPEESIPYLWDKFYKVDKARTRDYGGSGVGLSIVKAIMDSMKESYGVINYEDGVEFWFELDARKL